MLKEGEVAVLNNGQTHWYPIWKKRGQLYEGDSFNIDRLGPKFKDAKNASCFLQGMRESNCGPRSLVNAYFGLK